MESSSIAVRARPTLPSPQPLDEGEYFELSSLRSLSTPSTDYEFPDQGSSENTEVDSDEDEDEDWYDALSGDEPPVASRSGESEDATELSRWQRFKKSSKKFKKLSIYVSIISILGFVINATLVKPAFQSAETSKLATKYAAWEALKDFQSHCQSLQVCYL